MPAPLPPGPCPECGGGVEIVRARDGGAIEETRVTPHMQLVRRVRPATFYACAFCEWCAEIRPAAWDAHPPTDEHRAGCVECITTHDNRQQ